MRNRSIIVALAILGNICAGCVTEFLTPVERLARGKALFDQKAYPDAVKVLTQVTGDESAPPEVSSEALYWKAESYAAQGKMTNAYLTAKQLVCDFPSTKWAGKYMGKLPLWETNKAPHRDKAAK